MNWDIWGHEWAVDLFREHIVRDKVRHAYLFTGPRGVGRRTLALRLAQALNCKQPLSPGEPCLECRTCKQLARMQQPDLMVLQAEHEGGSLKVDMIREVQYSLALHPYESRFRIALFLRFEEATPQAMNALLKTLEEPAPKVVLLITAESVESLLPTVVSRCEVIRLRPVPLETLSRGLQVQTGLSDEKSRLLAHLADGRPGYALRLFEQPDILEQRNVWLDDLVRLVSASRVDRFNFAASFLDKRNRLIRPKFQKMLIFWLPYWRDILLKTTGTRTPIANIDRFEEIDMLAEKFGLTTAFQVVMNLERSLELLSKNANGRLIAEVTMLNLPYIQD